MATNKRPRKPYRPGRVYLNAHHIAMARVHKLQGDDVERQVSIVRHALTQFCRGVDCADHWRSLADAANVAEQLMREGIGAGAQAAHCIATAQRVLADVMQRRRQRGSWTLYGIERDALLLFQDLHTLQLQECDFAEYERALDNARNKITQARAGNAPAGAVIVEGEIR